MNGGNKLYWRPSKVPGRLLFLLAAAALGALLTVESFTSRESAEYYEEMLSASRIVQEAIEHLRPIRGNIEPINPEVDPARSGLIGIATSPITSNAGHLEAKQATINPNWAAVAVRLLGEAGVEPGDYVAVAASGSFPALNLAVYAAMQALDVKPIIIVSGAASQWGANVPGFAWMDIARHLRDARILTHKSVAATLGGLEDRGVGLNEQGKQLIRRAAERAGIELIVPESYEASVSERIRIYKDEAGDNPIAAMINIGGGMATTGPASIDHYFDSGVSRSAPSGAFRVPSVLAHFLRQDVPVINFSGIRKLATRYSMPYPPRQMPTLGSGGVYQAESYRRWLAGLMIVVLLALTGIVMRSANIALAAEKSGREGSSLKPKV